MKRRLLLVLVALVWLFPYLWMGLTSLKPLDEIIHSPTALLPLHPTLDAYREVFRTLPVTRYFLNTSVMALSIAALQIVLALPAGYALAKLRFRGKRLTFALIVATLLVPAQVRFVPVFSMLAGVHLVNTLSGLILPFGVSALGTFLVRQALLNVPDSQIEAARIDGASELTAYVRVALRMLGPGLVTVFLFQLTAIWNNFFLPMVMLSDQQLYPVSLGLYAWNSAATVSPEYYPIVIMGSLLAVLPLIVAFILLQRFWRSGLTAGAVK